MRRWNDARWASLFGLLLAACGGDDATLEATTATASAVRGALVVSDANGASVPSGTTARVPTGGAIAASEGGLVRVAIDSGPQLLLDASAHVTMPEDARIGVDAGRVYLDVMAGDAIAVDVAGASLRASDASMSISVEDGGARVYVVRGEVSERLGDSRSVVHAGQMLTLAGGSATVAAETLWADWTGGLVRTGPSDPSSAPGMGTLEARVPDEIGQARWPLVIRRLDVQVQVIGELAITEVQEVFFNPASETVEGLYRVRVPEGAVLERFAVDRNGRLVDGYVREEQQARAAYEAQVYRGSTDDPALLEWDAPGRYRARIYPIAPGEIRRIVIRYAEWLPRAYAGGPLLYRYPMASGAGAPHVGELAFVADVSQASAAHVRAGLGATVDGGRVELRRSDFAPRSDLWMELVPSGDDAQQAYRAPHVPPQRAPGSRVVVNEADERDYWYLPLRLPDSLFQAAEGARGLDVVIVADVSAGTDRAHLELGRGVAEAIAAHLGPDDRVSIVSSDLAIRAVADGGMALGPADPARVEALLDGLARAPAGGATDLGETIAQAGALLDPSRNGAVVYVGDGAPTVGELGSDSLLAHLVDQPHPIRLYAIAVGADANLDLLSELVHGGGLAMRVEEQDDAATAALDVLAHLSRPVLSRVTVDLGSGIENAFPRVPVDVVRGEVLEVVGRVRDAVPATVTIHGTFEGTDFETQVAVQTAGSDASADLRLRWASERLHQQLREGATREEIAELGTRYGLITPYTSYYVPSARELSQMGGWSQLFLHRPLVGPRGEGTLASAAFAVALGPLSIAGCGLSSSDAPAPMAEPVSVSGAVAPPEEAQAREVAAATAPMVAPTAPMAAPPAPPATTTPTTITTEAEERARGDLDAVLAGGAVTGSAADALAQAQGVGAAAAPTGDGAFYGRGGGGTGEGTIGLGDLGTIGHGSGTGEGQGYGSGGRAPMRRARASASAEPAPLRSHHAAPRPDANRVSGGGGGGYFVPVATQPASQQRAEDHARSRCSDAADLSLDDRRALWAERLRQASWVGGWVDVYRAAQRACEVHDARDRRAFLDALIDRAGSLSEMINVYTYLGDASARGYLRMAVLRRVRTPDDLRVVRGAFGGTFVDWVLVDQVLAHATTPAARLRALRGLLAQQPDSFDLRLRLLEELEVQQRTPELRRLAERMRVDPMADTGVRTAIGELFLRLGDEDEARRTFSEIVEFAPLDELARRRLGDLYRAHGWYEDAYRQYETLATIRPDDTTVLLLLAQAAAGAGRVDEALRLEERVMQTAPPGVIGGIARVAQLWSSVRFAELRQNARASSDDDSLNALTARMRRSGVLRGTGDLRVSLVWEHPDADVALYAAHPGLPYTRPDDLDGELGIEAFDVAEQEAGTYRVEVRRTSTDRVATVHARLVVVWHEGRQDEQVTSQDLTFAPGDYAQAWTITGTTLAAATASAAPPAPASPRGAR